MVFSDIIFIYLFLPLCFGLYFLRKNIAYRNTVLVLFSLFFYAWGEPVWVFLLMGTATLDYINGRFIARNRGTKRAILGVVVSLTVNLGLLATFKYSGFIVENINAISGLNLAVPSFTLPIGISFYTFQTITYIIDVYRGQVKAQKNYLYYLLYLSMFFQLVAGPIVRYNTIALEINDRKTRYYEFEKGMTRFVYGLAKKVIIANAVGELATTTLASVGVMEGSVFSAWFGVIMFSLQIYYDFSGYSDMAIGMGLMCGFHFLENFNYPYISRSATEFWRRWHMSLGTFFRDYLYIPLGGNRKHQLFNLAVVWFLTGLWHGASWNFIIWGCYFGLLIILEKFIYGKLLEKLPRIFSHIYLLFFVIIGWALFYFTDLNSLLNCLKTMFGMDNVPLIDEVSKSAMQNNIYIIILAIILCIPVYKLLHNAKNNLEKDGVFTLYLVNIIKVVFVIALIVISTILLVGQTYNPFLYYRF